MESPKILEFGAGGSTQIFAQCDAPEHIVSVETVQEWIDITEERMATLDNPKPVHFINYDIQAIQDTHGSNWDLIFIDGPDSLRKHSAHRTWEELNIGGDFGFMSVDAAVNGVYDSIDSTSKAITSQGYQHYTITVPGLMLGMPIDYSYQTFTGELTGFTHELSYGTTVSGVDVGLTLGKNDETSTGDAANVNTTYANFTLGYSF